MCSSADCCVELEMALGDYCMSSFNLENAICNHGFFMMAPNLWFPSTKTFQRPLRLSNSKNSVTVSISNKNDNNSLIIKVHSLPLSSADQQAIMNQVVRMLRLSEKDDTDVKDFHQMHSQAKESGFARLFRSPSLFEDTVKSILLCNCTWERSMKMAQALCDFQSELMDHGDDDGGGGGSSSLYFESRKKQKRAENIIPSKAAASYKGVVEGNFPNSRELAGLKEDFLKQRCNLGYRAKIILKLAKNVENGSLNLNKFEEATFDVHASYEQVRKELMKIRGFGPFASANVLMSIGFYQKIPVDTETIRLVQKVHGNYRSCTKRTIEQDVKEIYDKYAPFQCLAYWLELLKDYEEKFGKLSELPRSSYFAVTGNSVQGK